MLKFCFDLPITIFHCPFHKGKNREKEKKLSKLNYIFNIQKEI